jgi:dihydropteroate synthase
MLKNTFFQSKRTLNCRGKIINLSTPVVMGIMNLTPDSFYDGGKYKNNLDIIKHADKMLHDGAAILDMGAASSRPGASLIDPEKEKKRLIPALELLLYNFPDAVISVDTYNSATAREAVKTGAHMINDISAGSIDPNMFDTIAEMQIPYVMMHMKGVPQTMQNNPVYDDVVREIAFYFSQKIDQLRQLGVHDIIVDPGFGFGKTVEDNYRIMGKLEYFKILELPVLVGVSRKSLINKVLGVSPLDALNGTTVLNTLALQKGADILRVHDVKQAAEAVRIMKFYNDLERED